MGRPVEIVKIKAGRAGKREYQLQEEALWKIIGETDIRDRPVAVISIFGAARMGKSFLLSMLLRYLESLSDGKPVADWLQDSHEVGGFEWRGGMDSCTDGILMWSEPFIMRRQNGQELVVLLMDTQGVFDSRSTVAEWAKIFALSTMISSVQIYNISKDISEDVLNSLHQFADYGRALAEQSAAGSEEIITPFQRLLFLIRDWPNIEPYGVESGKKIMDERLGSTSTQGDDQKEMREALKNCFEKLECFLMPHPGMKVAQSDRKKFKGRVEDIDEEFLEAVHSLVSHLLGGENIEAKQLHGEAMKAGDLKMCLTEYVEMANSGDIEDPVSLVKANRKLKNSTACTEALDRYLKVMDQQFLDLESSVGDKQFDDLNSRAERAAEDYLHPKLVGNAAEKQLAMKKLGDEMLNRRSGYKSANERRRADEKKEEERRLALEKKMAEEKAAAEREKQRQREEFERQQAIEKAKREAEKKLDEEAKQKLIQQQAEERRLFEQRQREEKEIRNDRELEEQRRKHQQEQEEAARAAEAERKRLEDQIRGGARKGGSWLHKVADVLADVFHW